MSQSHTPYRFEKRRITPAIRAAVLGDEEDRMCEYCGAPASEVDHIVPVSRGGSDELDNLAPACYECNREKRDLSVVEWKNKRKAAGKPWPIPHYYVRGAWLIGKGIVPDLPEIPLNKQDITHIRVRSGGPFLRVSAEKFSELLAKARDKEPGGVA